MSVVMNAGDRNPFFLEAGAWFTASGACEVLVDRGPTKIRQKIGATEQQVGPFLSDAQILVIATAETTYLVHPAEAWVPASLVPGQIGDLSGITVADYTEFRASTSTAQQIEVTGRVGSGVPLGIAGTFVEDTSGSGADNGGTIIVRSDGARYRRVYDDAVNVLWFDTDNTGATDCSAEIIAANLAAAGGTLFFPNGSYLYSGDITPGIVVSGGKSIWQGAGWGTKLLAKDSTARILITINCSINDFWIIGSNSSSLSYVGTGIQIGNTGFVGHVELNRVRVRYFQTNLRLAAALITTISECRLEFGRNGIDFNAGGSTLFSTAITVEKTVISNHDRAGVTASYTPQPNLEIAFRGGAIENNAVEDETLYPQFQCPGVSGLNIIGVYSESSGVPTCFDISDTEGVSASGNMIYAAGKGFYGASGTTLGATITGNYMATIATYGVDIENGNRTFVAGNRSVAPNRVTGSKCSDIDTYKNAVQSIIEGNFTPTLEGSTTPGTPTLTTAAGTYNRIGNQITFRGRITVTATTGMVGNVRIGLGALPNTVSANQAIAIIDIATSNIAYDAGYTSLSGQMNSGGTDNYVTLYEYGSNVAASQIAVANITVTATIRFSGTYTAAELP